MNTQNTILKDAHDAAFSKAKKKMPDLDVNLLIKYGQRLADGEKPEKLAFEFAGKYQGAMIEYIRIFSQRAIDDSLKNTDSEFMQKLGKEKIGKILVDMAPDVSKAVIRYMKREITPEEFVVELYETDLGKVSSKIINALGIDEKNILDPTNIMKISSPMLAYNASIAAYKEYRKAMDDLEIAKEERMRIENACNESIRMIREYREELNARVNKYLTEHYSAFEEGLSLMDQAIIDEDADGYIKGNNVIQEILVYKNIQYHNRDEFDALMESDEDFVL